MSYWNLNARDPISSMTHFWGAVISLAGTLILAIQLLSGGAGEKKTVSVMIFGTSLVALYACSSLYHFVKTTPARTLRLRKLDHAMIYVLIAGTYTPILLNYLQGEKALRMTALIWIIGLAGVALMLLWFSMPRWLSTLFYLAMGWFLVYDLDALRAMEPGAIALLVIGGIFYTAGGIIYALKKPNILQHLGFHEIFHIFVLLGSAFHFLAISLYVI